MLNEQEKIERYLNGEMNDAEKSVFEQEMKNNKVLSDEVALTKDLADFFKDRKIGIEHTLSNLGNEYFTDEKPAKPNNSTPHAVTDSPSFNNARFIAPALLLLVIIIGCFWYFNNTDENPADMYVPEMTATEAEKIINDGMLDEQGNEVINNENTAPKIEENQQIEPIDSKKEIPKLEIEEIKETPKKEEKPMATLDEANFKENSVLESLIRENVRSDSQTSITAPFKGQTFQQKKGMVILNFKGVTTEEDQFEVVIYDNKITNFNNDYRVLNALLKKTPDDDGFKLSFNLKVELKPGLYYYIIRQKDNPEIIHISKFLVK
jgi:hypothetical protein